MATTLQNVNQKKTRSLVQAFARVGIILPRFWNTIPEKVKTRSYGVHIAVASKSKHILKYCVMLCVLRYNDRILIM
jgi:hypothetical protein